MRRLLAGAALLLAGCGGAEQDFFVPRPSTQGAQAGHAGAAEAGAGGAGEVHSVGGGGAAGEIEELGGAAGGGGAALVEAGAGGAFSMCEPEAEDVPDDEFVDSNCDGIDGDAARGVFVSPSGADINSGSLDAPLRTLRRAVELATERRAPIYVCTASYAENLLLDKPVAIYGGYDCERQWRRSKDVAEVKPTSGLALTIQNVAGPVHLERLAFRVAPGISASQSSQAAAIRNSRQVTAKRVEFEASAGADGKHGTDGDQLEAPPRIIGASGGSAEDCVPRKGPHGTGCWDYPEGGFDESAVLTCSYRGRKYEMRGGRGGHGGNPRADTEDLCMAASPGCGELGHPGEIRIAGGAWTPVAASSARPTDECSASTDGEVAPSGSDGTDGASASSPFGTFHSAVYFATNGGEPGTEGEPGLPGRGGDGITTYSGWNDVLCSFDYRVGEGGGQGGPGGCGGKPATPGGAGGGSIALGIEASRVVLSWCRIITGTGGRGGFGALGGFGHRFHGIDTRTQELTSAGNIEPGAGGGRAGNPGQWGGPGGRGGDAGAGAGGPSIGIIFEGEAPEVVESSFALGLPGRGGVARSLENAPTGANTDVYRFVR